MNWLDIVIALLVLYALWEGWRQGVITQVLGLVSVLAGLFLAWKYGTSIGEWLGAKEEVAVVVGFVVVLIVVIVAVFFIGRLTRGLFRIAGLGAFDGILGVLFSLLKMCVFIGLAMMLIEFCDPGGKFISEGLRARSVMWGFVEKVNGVVFPFIEGFFK